MKTISTEAGVTILLVFSMIMVIFTVVGFNKTARDLERIDESVKNTQLILQEQNKAINKLNVDKRIEK